MTPFVFALSLLYVASATSPYTVPFKVRPLSPSPEGPRVQNRIHGGMAAAEGQFPFMIFAVMNLKEMGISKCSSSLINPEWVLLAAHCLAFRNLLPRDVLLVGGKADLADYVKERIIQNSFYAPVDESKWGLQERRARRLFVHPSYSEETIEHDVALVHLQSPFRLGPVQTIPISTDKITSVKKCTVLGWGLTLGNVDLQKLNFIEDKKVSTTKLGCRYKSRGPFVCLEPAGGGICMGDSGSPLVCDGKVWGVASHYMSMSEWSDCGDSLEEYYSELHSDIDWIRDVGGQARLVDGGGSGLSSSGTVLLCTLFALWSSKAKL